MKNDSQRVHLHYLDGLRGLSALYVVIHHIWQFVVTLPDAGVFPTWFRAMTIFKFGSYGVSVFIVLSGYCLMLPVVRSSGAKLNDGFGGFIRRRARRILPPYYAALILSVILIMIVPALRQQTNTQWDFALPALDPIGLFYHALLVHNLFEQWQWITNPPLWSVALEWQIYFVFGLVLLPLWRRFGMLAMLIIATIAGLLPIWFGGDFASTWMLGLFAIGMLSAAINFSPNLATQKWIDRTPWGPISFILWFIVFGLLFVPKQYLDLHMAISDSIVGIAAGTFIVYYTRGLQKNTRNPLRSIFENRLSIKIGTFSYSLYLIHYPIVALLLLQLLQFHLSAVTYFGLLVVLGMPSILIISYGFHYLFERPFIQKAPQKRVPLAPIVVARVDPIE